VKQYTYYLRIGLTSLALALALGLALWIGPRAAPLTLVAQTPNGEAVAVGAPIRVSFARPVDRRSAESNFRIEPYVPGRFFWQDTTLTYEPTQPLAAETAYRVSILPGLRDEQGRQNAAELAWEFRTRGPRLLAVRAGAGGGSELWLARPDGAEATQLLTTTEPISDLIVAPDGTRAIIVEARGLERSALVLVSLEDGSTRLLVDDVQASVAAPAWAPVGDFIAFERRGLLEGSLGVPRIWLGQPDGTLLGPLYGGDGSEIAYAPSWSPDGNRVAFIDGLTQALTVYDFFTDVARPLGVASAERAVWLPDGAGLVVSAIDPERPERAPGLTSIPYPEGAVVALIDSSQADLSPAVSPDGNRIVFVRRVPDGPASAIWVVATDGSTAEAVSAGTAQDTQPLWSPDGTQIAFLRSSLAGELQSDLVVVDLATGAETVALADVVQAVWAP
jgi:Tol biopolymer transport system component